MLGYGPKDFKFVKDISFFGFFTQLAKVNPSNEYSALMKTMLDSSVQNFKTQMRNSETELKFAQHCLVLVKGLDLAKHTNLPWVAFRCVLAFIVFPVFIYLLATKRLLKSDVEHMRDKFVGKLEEIERKLEEIERKHPPKP